MAPSLNSERARLCAAIRRTAQDEISDEQAERLIQLASIESLRRARIAGFLLSRAASLPAALITGGECAERSAALEDAAIMIREAARLIAYRPPSDVAPAPVEIDQANDDEIAEFAMAVIFSAVNAGGAVGGGL